MGEHQNVARPDHVRWVLDDYGHPVVCRDPFHWSRWMGSVNRLVAAATIGRTEVLTTFVGVDEDATLGGVPRLWETRMVGGDRAARQRWRWTTYEEAIAGHGRVVRWIVGTGERP